MHTISPVQKSNENWKIPVWNWIIQWWTLNKHIWLALVKQIYGIFSHSFRFFLFCWSIESEKFSERIKASERKNQQRKALVKPYNNKNTCHWRKEKKSRIEKWCLNSSIHLSKALSYIVSIVSKCVNGFVIIIARHRRIITAIVCLLFAIITKYQWYIISNFYPVSSSGHIRIDFYSLELIFACALSFVGTGDSCVYIFSPFLKFCPWALHYIWWRCYCCCCCLRLHRHRRRRHRRRKFNTK